LLSLTDLEASPPPGTLLARLEDLPSHGGKEIIFTEDRFRTSIFIQKINAEIRVFLNYCPHAGTPLNMFDDRFLDMQGTQILCRTHGALFDPISGKCTRGPCKGDHLRQIAHEIKDGGVYSL
jgi:nitrite reductase/ring-hydroxylating ferredoxin subunit